MCNMEAAKASPKDGKIDQMEQEKSLDDLQVAVETASRKELEWFKNNKQEISKSMRFDIDVLIVFFENKDLITPDQKDLLVNKKLISPNVVIVNDLFSMVLIKSDQKLELTAKYIKQALQETGFVRYKKQMEEAAKMDPMSKLENIKLPNNDQ